MGNLSLYMRQHELGSTDYVDTYAFHTKIE